MPRRQTDTIAVLAGQLANGSATLAPPFVSRQAWVVVLAAIPAVLGILASSYHRRTRTPAASAFHRPALLD